MDELATSLHELWVGWTSHVIKTYPGLPQDLVVSWKNASVPFSKLTEQQKDKRRSWAKSVTKKKASDPRTKELAKDFIKYCEEINGYKPEVNWGMELTMIGAKLKTYTPEQLREEFYWFLSSDHQKKLGCTIKIALCSYVFNKWLADQVGQ